MLDSAPKDKATLKNIQCVDYICQNLPGKLAALLKHQDINLDCKIQAYMIPEIFTPGQWWTEFTPLQLAIYKGHPNIVNTLLEAGAQIDCRGKSGATPLITAVKENKTEIANQLLSARANPKIRDNYGITALHCAAYKGNGQLIRQLLMHGAEVNALTIEGKSPLFGAISANHTETVRLLLSNGASVTSGGWLTGLLQTAIFRKNHDIILQLVKAGIDPDGDINHGNERGETLSYIVSDRALHYSESEIQTITEFLLNCGANPNKEDDSGLTPFGQSVLAGRPEITALLTEHGAAVQNPLKKELIGSRSVTRHESVEAIIHSLDPLITLKASCRLCIRKTIVQCRKEGESLISNTPLLPLPESVKTYICNIR